MQRLTSALVLLGGAVLLLIWQVSPATSAPKAAPSALSTSLEQTGPVVSEVNTQVDQLRGRLQQVKPYPEPTRDPFNFGTRAVPKPAAPPRPPAIEVPAPPVLPELVAIVGDAKTERRAVLSAGDDVRFVKVGEATGVFVVQSLSADTMVVVDQTTGKSYTVILR